MDDAQISAVQDSFAQVAPIKDTAAELFYARHKRMIAEHKHLTEQGAKLMATLGAVVNGLRDLPKIVPVAEDLARRHVDYGVEADHYPLVGQALLDTLEKGLGDGFTDDVRAAWTTAYGTLSAVMIAAAYPKGDAA